MGVAKWQITGKGFINKAETESPEFLPALGLFIFKKKSVTTTQGKLDS